MLSFQIFINKLLIKRKSNICDTLIVVPTMRLNAQPCEQNIKPIQHANEVTSTKHIRQFVTFGYYIPKATLTNTRLDMSSKIVLLWMIN
jgi:hypothetical protein